jgi:hypothetical protein
MIKSRRPANHGTEHIGGNRWAKIISLQGPQIDLTSDRGRELITDLARFSEELVSEATIRKKYRFSKHDWETLGSNDKLLEMVEDEKTRRVRDGSIKREKAQQLVVKAPGVLGDIMDDPNANPRHRIDSAKALDDFAAANGPEAAAAGARFVIQINLGADHIETYSKSIAVNAEDEDPYHPTPPEVLAAIAAKKNEGDGGNHI